MLSLRRLRGKYENWLDSDKKLRKLFVSCHYYLFRYRKWKDLLELDTKSKFTEIYRNNLWNNEESRSGGGSTLNRTAKIREGLQQLFVEEDIRSLCDAGCGDFNWMKTVSFDHIRYIGIDIVPEMIESNRKSYERGNISFAELDLTRDELPSVDLILSREVLFHLSFQDLFAALRNFKKSGARYLLTTHYPDIRDQRDIPTGRCRAINFRLEPLNFPEPLRTIEEDVSDHCLALWKLEDIDPSGFGDARAVPVGATE